MLTDSIQPGFQERGIDWIDVPFHWIEDWDPLAVVQKHKDDAEEALSKGDHEDAILALAQTASAFLQVYDHCAYPSMMSDLHRRILSSDGQQMLSALYHITLYADEENKPPQVYGARKVEEEAMSSFREWRLRRYGKFRPASELNISRQQRVLEETQIDPVWPVPSPSSSPLSSPSNSLYLTPSSNSSTSSFASLDSPVSMSRERPSRQPDLETAPSRDSEITVAHLRRSFRHKLEVTWMQDLLGPHHDGTAVQQLMDLLQSELDCDDIGFEFENSGLRRGTYHRRCLRALRQLSARYELLPSSLVIQDVEREGHNPVAGGGFADIWRGTVKQQTVCLKVLRLIIEPEEEVRQKIRKQFCNEALLWRQLKHPNILPLLGVNAELFNPSFCLISPWMANKDLITYLKQNPKHRRQDVLLEIAAGLSYLHSRDPPIIHGDIRGANILVTDEYRCCLADFGLALVTAESRTWSIATTSTLKGAIRWMAPELIIQDPSAPNYDKASGDVYAFACTIVEILTLQLPFHDQRTDAAVLYSLLSGKRPGRPQDVWCPDAIWDLTTRCWTQDPAARPTAREVNEALETLEHG